MKLALLLFLFLSTINVSSQCSTEEYLMLLNDAKKAKISGDFELAIKKLSSASVCRPEKEEEINKLLLEVYQEVNIQKELALKGIKEVYANNLSFNSQLSLSNGDRTLAYRLAEIAHKYVDPNNILVEKAFLNAVYYNDNSQNQPIRWYSTFIREDQVVLAVSSDGRLIATAANDEPIIIWEMGSGKEVISLQNLESPNHDLTYSSFTFSNSGNLFATTSERNIVKIWDLKSGQKVHEFTSSADSVLCIAFSFDESLLAIGMDNNLVDIWNLISNDKENTLHGHTDFISHVSFSKDNKLIATGSLDGTVKIWNILSGDLIHSLNANVKPMGIMDLIFSPDGQKIASIGFLDDKINLWDVSSGNLILSHQNKFSVLVSAAFSPNSEIIALGNLDRNISLLNLSSNNLIDSFNVGQDGISDLIYFPDGKQIGSVGFLHHDIKIWELQTQNEAKSLYCGNDRVWDIDFSPDGRKIATAGWRNYIIKSKNLFTQEENYPPINISYSSRNTYSQDSLKYATLYYDSIFVRKINPGILISKLVDTALCLNFSANGQKLITGGHTGKIKIWDLSSNNLEYSVQTHTDSILSVAFSQDGKYLASGSVDKTCKVWDLISENEILSIEDTLSISSVAFSNSGSYLAIGFVDGRIKIYNLLSKLLFLEFIDSAKILNLKFSINDSTFHYGTLNNTIKIWDAINGQLISDLPCVKNVTSIAFSPDGQKIATSIFSDIQIWDLLTMKQIGEFSGHNELIFDLAFSNDGKRLASASGDSTVKVWNIQTGEQMMNLINHEGIVYSVAFSPDGRSIASGSWDKTVIIWDLTLGKIIHILKKHIARVNSVSFNSDGSLLAVGSSDRSVSIWNPISGIEICSFSTNYNDVNDVVFAQNDKWVIGACGSLIKIWDLNSRNEIANLYGHSNKEHIHRLSISPEGTKLASAAWDRTAKIWELSFNGWDSTSGRKGKTMAMSSSQLDEFGMGSILTIPGSEQLILQSGDTWFISSFAKFLDRKITLSSNPNLSDYMTALKFYKNCLESNLANQYFDLCINKLNKKWNDKN